MRRTAYINSACLDEIREDLLDSYEYIHSRLNADIFEAGGSSMVDGTRCCVFGWSAGGANSIFLVSRLTSFPTSPVLICIGLRRLKKTPFTPPSGYHSDLSSGGF